MDDFHRIKAILRGDAPFVSHKDLESFTEVDHRRLLRAIPGGSGKPGAASDLAGLIRHVLRHECEVNGGTYTLDVPNAPEWPDGNIWGRAGVRAHRLTTPEGKDFWRIDADSWRPEWLPHTDRETVDGPAFAMAPRRRHVPAEGDAILRLVGRETYRNGSQQAALRAALATPLGGTLVVNLPTGSGKSLCAQVPALLLSRVKGVTVVVVPTVALALDQERVMRQYLPDLDMAYFEDSTIAGKARREGIRARIQSGEQRIVFTSPEGLMESLAASLFDAAGSGYLRLFVVDEAHMVDQWGDEFRPAFQEIPGLRRELLKAAPAAFRTLLLTATLTQGCLDALEALFEGPGPFDIVSAVQLRPEPSFWFSDCGNAETKASRLLEAIHHLPRPLIVYGSTREEVRAYYQAIVNQGYRRVGTMDGETKRERRRELLNDWSEGEVDIVVATSAFGLGVDQGEVRAVVHACIPETIDRFYQEVGRAGRDGRASISLTLHCPRDLETAQGLNQKRYIGIERGHERWCRMFDDALHLGGARFRLDLDRTRVVGGETSAENRLWNSRTLTLMARAGILRIEFERPPQRQRFVDTDTMTADEAFEKALDEYRQTRVVEVIEQLHRDKDLWNGRITPLRDRLRRSNTANLRLMRNALRGSRCISYDFEEAYRIPSNANEQTRFHVGVTPSCGGCPRCREGGTGPLISGAATPPPTWRNLSPAIGPVIASLLAGKGQLLVTYVPGGAGLNWKQQRDKFLRWLLSQGIRSAVASDEVLLAMEKVAEQVPEAFVLRLGSPSRTMTRLPTLVYLEPREQVSREALRALAASDAPPAIIFAPDDTIDPNSPTRKLCDCFPGAQIKFEVLMTRFAL